MKHWIFFGHSHLAALQRAWSSMSKKTEFSNHQVHFFIIDHKNIYDYFTVVGDETKPSENLINQINKVIDVADDVEMVLSLAGNDHSIIGLANAEHEYLVMGAESENAKQQPPQILSRDLLSAVFEERLVGVKQLIPQLIECFQLKPCLIESPPPLFDQQRIKNHPGIFSEILEKFGVNQSQNRLTLWEIQNKVMHQYADDNSINFIKNPQQIYTEGGFLLEEFAGQDPTHGNDDYGVAVLKNLFALNAVKNNGKDAMEKVDD